MDMKLYMMGTEMNNFNKRFYKLYKLYKLYIL